MNETFFRSDPQRPDPSEFLCGVVEGFYGQTWTYPQRRELFRRMQSMGMNAYLYAPKDDLKHRLSWRDPYTEKEEESMRTLIAAAEDHNVRFIFAISPGSDVVYSSALDINSLTARLKQATELGCHAFALLFDDIDTRLCPADQELYKSPGCAQVALTNKIYEALNCPDTFLFCPTEYCASRAVPNVAHSNYLTTLGSELAQGINVLWTGPLVVSKRIPTLGIRDLSRLLKRPIVLWDNLHANDYDQRRIFLGPYAGRPLALRRRKLIRGVLTNPNCEFEANFVAIHTLAQWVRLAHPSYADGIAVATDLADIGDDLGEQTKSQNNNETGVADEALGNTPSSSVSDSFYRPRQALLNALRDWLSLMLQDQQSTSVVFKKPTATAALTSPMETDFVDCQHSPMQVESAAAEVDTNMKHELDVNMESSETVDVISSLGIGLADLELLSDLFYLPFSHGPTALQLLELGHWLRENSHLAQPDNCSDRENVWCKKFTELLTIITNVNQLREKIQRLPHPGVVYDLAPYLTDINSVLTMVLDYVRWLESGVMSNRNQAHLKRLLTWFSPGYSDMTMSGDHEPWMFRGGLITELQRILPLESAQDLFPAPSRVGPTMTTTPAGQPINAASGGCSNEDSMAPKSHLTALSKANPETLEFQPRRPYILRSYRPEDKPKIYALWRQLVLYRLGLPKDALPEKYKDLPGDRYCLAYLERFPQHCLIVEGPPLLFDSLAEVPSTSSNATDLDTVGWDVVAFALAAPDIGALTRERDELRRDRLCAKYPKDEEFMQEAHKPIPRKPSIHNRPLQFSANDFIRISLDWIHHNQGSNMPPSSIISEVALAEAPPPEPLGAAISDSQLPTNLSQQPQPMAVEEKFAKDTEGEQTKSDLRAVEAIHSALMAHPASILVELNDCGSAGPPMTPTMMMNHHLGLGFDPPELVLDEVARRLFVCLLAGLKTCASHGVHVELDTINETRADLYRRFGFYPVTAASTDFVTVLGRLI